MITSPSNAKLKYVRHLGRRSFRDRENRMLLEGVRLVEEALKAACRPSFVLVSDALDRTDRGVALRERLTGIGVPVLEVDAGLLDDVADTATPQGLVAVVAKPELPVTARPTLLLLLDGVRDPGNVGTALRAAHAAGADAVLLAPGTADASSPKVVRAAMGAHFHVPVRCVSWDQFADTCREASLGVWIADAGGAVPYTAADLVSPAAIVVGGEADGPSGQAMGLGTTVRIPMQGTAESLNAGVTAAVLLFEAVRQRGA